MSAPVIFFAQKYVLLDIEGTISPKAVMDGIFKYFINTIKQFLDERWDNEDVQMIVAMLKNQCCDDADENLSEIENIANNIIKQTRLARQSPVIEIMRKLQHLVLEDAFKSEKLKLEIFADVQPAMKFWKDHGKVLYTYSSGSASTQKILFEHCNSGNLLEFLSGCFDLGVGRKTEPSSYVTIADKLNCSTSDIIFITNIAAEAYAASVAGCRALISIRSGNVPISDIDRSRFVCISGFDEVVPNTAI